jgi:TATA-binding protein-associated factor Taf7
MSFNIDPKKTGSINDGGRRLKVGTARYKITGATMAIVKSDPRGKEQQVVLDLLNGGDYACKVFLSVSSANETAAEIAKKTLVAFWDAAGLTGAIKPETLKRLVGKTVDVTTRETQGKGENKDKTYVNISTVEAADDEDAEEAEETEEEETEETEEDSEEEEEAEAPKKTEASGKKARPW